MNADSLFEHFAKRIDDAVADCGVRAAQELLDAGAKVEDLRILMQPVFQLLANWRAEQLAELRRGIASVRARELRVAVIEGHRSSASRARGGALTMLGTLAGGGRNRVRGVRRRERPRRFARNAAIERLLRDAAREAYCA